MLTALSSAEMHRRAESLMTPKTLEASPHLNRGEAARWFMLAGHAGKAEAALNVALKDANRYLVPSNTLTRGSSQVEWDALRKKARLNNVTHELERGRMLVPDHGPSQNKVRAEWFVDVEKLPFGPKRALNALQQDLPALLDPERVLNAFRDNRSRFMDALELLGRTKMVARTRSIEHANVADFVRQAAHAEQTPRNHERFSQILNRHGIPRQDARVLAAFLIFGGHGFGIARLAESGKGRIIRVVNPARKA